jgi:uncharacterized membrane protein YebE (DUF533 family)
VQTAAIVENLDVVEEGVAQEGPIRPRATVDKLLFEGSEEGLGDSVVPTIAFAAHADGNAESRKLRAIVRARVLTAAVGVVRQAVAGAAPADGHLEGGERECCRQRSAHRPTHDGA